MSMDVYALFVSPTGNTASAVRAIARGIASKVSGGDYFSIDLTPFDARRGVYDFGPDDIVIIGAPTYAGRIPNKLQPYFTDSIYGDGSVGVSVVTYGNRAYDDSLKELYSIMTDNGFDVCAATAVCAEHAFTNSLAAGRPDDEDLAKLTELGKRIGDRILTGKARALKSSDIPGRDMDDMKYYVPKKEDGEPASFLKAMPITDTRICTNCGECKRICPMNCYNNSVSEPEGICIKCQGCIKACPVGAKHFEDEDFLSHVKYLEREYSEMVHEIEIFE